jgi:hypothetical protein
MKSEIFLQTLPDHARAVAQLDGQTDCGFIRRCRCGLDLAATETQNKQNTEQTQNGFHNILI